MVLPGVALTMFIALLFAALLAWVVCGRGTGRGPRRLHLLVPPGPRPYNWEEDGI